MIRDEEVFDEEWVPQDVEYRHYELDHLSVALQPTIDGQADANVLIFGGSGVGKTCTTRHLIRQLDHEHPHVTTAYVNCWNNHATFDCLYQLTAAVAPTHDIHRRSTPTSELHERVRETVTLDEPVVAVLDEVDRLDDKDLLYQLDCLSGLSLILVSNRERDLFDVVDERVGNRLRTGVRIEFDRYSIDDLAGILKARARKGLAPGTVTGDQLRTLADLAAGEARAAIQGLHEAALLADSETGITDAVLEQAVTRAREKVRQQTSEKLTQHERVLLEIIRNAGTIAPGDLYDAYTMRVADPRTERTMRNYLSKMAHYNLIEATGKNKARRYHAISSPTDR